MKHRLVRLGLLLSMTGCIAGPPEGTNQDPGEDASTGSDATSDDQDVSDSSDFSSDIDPDASRWRVRLSNPPIAESVADFPLLVRVPDELFPDDGDFHFTDAEGTVLPDQPVMRTSSARGHRVGISEVVANGDTAFWLVRGPAPSNPASPLWPESFVGAFSFDEAEGVATDRSGVSSLSCMDAVCGRVPGILGRAYDSTGDSHMTVADASRPNFQVNDGEALSVGFWAKTTTEGSPVYAANFCVGWYPLLNPGLYWAAFGTNNDGNTATDDGCVDQQVYRFGYAFDGATPLDGEWHHYGIVVDRRTNAFQTYYDGTLQGDVEITTDNPSELGVFRIGLGANGAKFIGQIDEVWAAREVWNQDWYSLYVKNVGGELDIVIER